jgi:hypothetical protein
VLDRYGDRGGGLFIRTSGPVVENNTIRWNSIGSPWTTLQPFPEGAGIACFVAHPVITGNSILENENIALQSNGGAIYCKNSRPWIKKNLIQNNRAVNGAAGFFTESQPAISGNTIVSNTMYYYPSMIAGATYGALTFYICRDFLIDGNHMSENIASNGAAICVLTCFNGRILNNVIAGNRAEQANLFVGMGAGIYLQLAETPLGDHLDDVLILNNTIVNNTAIDLVYNKGGWGGGIAIALLEERMVIANNIVAFNSSGIWQEGTLTAYPDFIRNDFFDNQAGDGNDYNYVNLSPGPTDISLDPLFVKRAGGDYRLTSASPCIDAGDATVAGLPTTDIDGNTRPKDGNFDGIVKIDIGAYEFSQCVGDFEGQDGDVDGMDLAAYIAGGSFADLPSFAASFGRTNCP